MEARKKLETVPTADEISLGLRSQYNNNALFKDVMDNVENSECFKSEGGKYCTEAEALTKLLESLKHIDTKYHVILLFKALSKIGLGTYLVGRHNKKTRFIWDTSPLIVSQVAQGKVSDLETNKNSGFNQKKEITDITRNIPYQLTLRANYILTFQLPEDLTREEAEKISNFCKNCLITR